jgi:RHS repeat-associated protein
VAWLGVLPLAMAFVLVLAFTAGAQEEDRSGLKRAFTPPPLPAGIDAEDLPRAGERGAQGLQEAFEREQRRVEERERELASAGARDARERSRTAHLGASDAAAAMLAGQKFGDLLDGAAAGSVFADIARGREVQRFVDDYTMVLEGTAEQPPVLVESPWPVRAVADDGRKRAVDLSLEPIEGGLKPVNAASDIKLPASLADGVELGEIGVVPAGSADVQVSKDGGSHAVYANAEVDTDVIVTPLATGVELFWQLRSPRAAEQVAFDLDLPEGALAEEGKGGSVVVSRDGKALAVVRPPVAVDAQGQDVPVDMSVTGTQVTVSVPHREKDLAYPILVDPVIEDYWISTGAWIDQMPAALDRIEDWIPNGGSSSLFEMTYGCLGPYTGLVCNAAAGRPNYDPYEWDGLHVYVDYDVTYPAGAYAEWVYLPPGTTTRVQEAGFYGFYNRRFGNDHPYMYTGIWSMGANTWAGSPGTYTQTFGPQTLQHFGGGTVGPQGVVFGFRTGINISNPTWRDGYMGAAILALTDPEAPSISAPSLYRLEPSPTAGQPDVWTARPSGWMRRSDVVAVRAAVSDPGLGLTSVQLAGAGMSAGFDFGCVGNRDSMCPAALAANEADQLETTIENAAEGIGTAYLHAWDPLGRQTSVPVAVKVDDTSPQVDLSGALWSGKEDPAGSGTPVLGAGTHGLTIETDDPPPSSAPGATTSGVEKIEVKVDGDVVATESSDFEWVLDTSVYGGKRTVRVVVTDGAGNQKSRAFVVNLPTRGELVLPVDAESTSSRLALLAEAREDGFSGVEFQYREMPAGLWKTIGGSGTMLRDDQGNVVSATSHPLDQPDRRTKKLIWDARTAIDLAMLTPKPGPFQLRAVFAGNGGHTSKAVNVELDPKGLSAGNAQTEVGPGSLDLLTGNFAYSATDAALSGFGQGLTLMRTHNSLDPEVGGGHAPMGPGWVMSSPVEGISDYSSLIELTAPGVEKWVDVYDSAGMRIRFELLADDSFKPEPGFEDLTLAKDGNVYTLTDLDGTVTTFSTLAGSTQPVQFVPSKVQEAGQQGISSFKYQLHAGKPQLTRIIAPPPPGLDCTGAAGELQRGCKVLELEYGDINLGPSGQFRRLKRIRHIAWDPATSAMKDEAVAEFTYYEHPADAGNLGRLKEAWDPRVSPALKERYFYDSVGRLRELAPPGESSWWLWYNEPSTADEGKFAWVVREADGSGLEGWSVNYRMPLTGYGAWFEMGPQVADAIGQTDRPTDGTVVVRNAPGEGQYLFTGHYLNQDGREVNVARPGMGTTTTEYDKHGNVVRELSAQNRADALAAGGGSVVAAGLLSTYRTYSADGLRMVEELGPEHEVKLDSGQVVDARAHTVTAYDEGSTLPVGKPAHLPTTVTTGAQVDPSEPDEDVRVSKTEYDWTLRKPTATITDATSGGLNITDRTTYNQAGLETSSQMPKSDGTDAGTMDTVYYAADASAPYDACDNKPEWHNLVCGTVPAAQPGVPGLPELPITVYTYDRLGQVATATEYAIGAGAGLDTRTTTSTFDEAGRTVKTKVESTAGHAVEEVTAGYDSATGRPTTLSTPSGTITTDYDNVGRVVSYTDANGWTSTTSYDRLNRPDETVDGGAFTQTFGYGSNGMLTELEDSDAGTFTAGHDLDGRIVSKGYPNGMEAETTYDPAGAPTQLVYTKTSNCSANCVWIDEQVQESIHGQWRSHVSDLSEQRYFYDNAGRLTAVADDVQSPATVEGCTIRVYSFDLNSNRTGLNTKAPDSNGDCQPGAAGTTRSYSHDTADRLTGTGVDYDSFGRMTSIPAQHSGGGVLSYTYYADEQVRTISQDGVSKTYTLDPAGRHYRTQVSDGTTHSERLLYRDGSDSPTISQTLNSSQEVVSGQRYIEGIDGDLGAIRSIDIPAETDETVLQLSNLHGDTIATASLDPQATQLLDRFETDEYGNPRQAAGADKRYGWLGGKQRRTELASGVIQMGVRSYVPSLGRFTSVDPIKGGSANDYDYANQDPINTYDLDGRHPVKVLFEAGKKVLGKGPKRVKRVVRGGGSKAMRVRMRYTETNHLYTRMGERGLSEKRIRRALRHGTLYWDTKYSNYAFVLRKAGSKKGDYVTYDSWSGNIRTAIYRRFNPNNKRWIRQERQ